MVVVDVSLEEKTLLVEPCFSYLVYPYTWGQNNEINLSVKLFKLFLMRDP